MEEVREMDRLKGTGEGDMLHCCSAVKGTEGEEWS
jgi:hypothetical protein